MIGRSPNAESSIYSLGATGNLSRMMRLADYVAQTLVRHGIEHIFLVTGGGAMISTTRSDAARA